MKAHAHAYVAPASQEGLCTRADKIRPRTCIEAAGESSKRGSSLLLLAEVHVDIAHLQDAQQQRAQKDKLCMATPSFPNLAGR